MAVSYKNLLYLMIERDITNIKLMHDANFSANIITKIKNGKYIALRKYDQNLRERLADKYTTRSEKNCDLANEWWDKLCALSDEKSEKVKAIISLNKFKEEDYECTDPEILEILSYYRITRDIAEGNNQEGLRLWQKAKILNGKNSGVTII